MEFARSQARYWLDGRLNAVYPTGQGKRDIPDYIEQGDRGFSVRFVRAPELAEVPYPVKMEPNLVVEYYAS